MAKNQNAPIQEWITARQASELLCITSRHVKRLIQSGELEGRLIGIQWLINPESVANWKRKRAPNKPKDTS